MTDDGTTQQTRPRVIADRYALLAEIGRGGMGVVWRGEDRVIERPVAVKELRLPDSAEDAGVFQERVLREVRTGGRLNDPAVVTVFDVVPDGDTTFIVMELVDAPTLSDVVSRYGPLPPPQVASIGEQVLGALQSAHQAGIVHRDVKPGNIMVAPNGRVKLTDFGIAQAVDDPRLTTSGFLVGSPAFMAPERVGGREAMPASDLWSLGATLFYAVEGMVAFERQTTAATLHAIMTEVPYLTHTQGPLASAIMGLLISSPEARLSAPQARQLLSMTASGAGQANVPTAQHTAAYPRVPTAPTAPTNRIGTGIRVAAAVVAVALLVGGLLLGKWWGTPSDTADPAMAPTFTYGTGGDVAGFAAPRFGPYNCIDTSLAVGTRLVKDNWINCDELHFGQYFGVATAVDESSSSEAVSADYPTHRRLRRFAEAYCSMVFHSNVIDGTARSDLRYRALIPTEQAWTRAPIEDAARSIHCVTFNADGTTRRGSAARPVR